MAGIVHLLPNGQQQFCDNNGDPLAGGFVYHYVPGTTTPSTTWVDQGLTTANTNPIKLDAGGRATIWGNTSYRQLLTDSLGNTVWDQITGDGALNNLVLVNPTITGGTITGTNISGGTITASIGPSIVTADGPNPNPPLNNPTQGARTVAAFVGSFVDARNFLGNGGAALRATSDDSSIIQAAINYAQSIGGATVYLGPGPLKIPAGSGVNWPNSAAGVNLKGDGALTTLITVTGNLTSNVFSIVSGAPQSCGIYDLGITCIGSGTFGSLIQFENTHISRVENVFMVGGFNIGIAISGGANQSVAIIRDVNSDASGAATTAISLGNDPAGSVSGVTIDTCNLVSGEFGVAIGTGTGLYISNSTVFSVINNGITVGPPTAQSASTINIVNCQLNSCGQSGIDIGGSGGTSQFVSISDTSVSNCNIGVATRAGAGVTGNISMTGCNIFGNALSGISGIGTSALAISSCILIGNGTASSGLYSAIDIENGLHCAILGNSIAAAGSGQQSFGIFLGGTTDYCTVVGNTTSGGAAGSIGDSSSGTHNVKANNTGT